MAVISHVFHAWELRGRYPSIFDDAKCGDEAKKLYDEAQFILQKIIKEKGVRVVMESIKIKNN